MEKLIKSFAVAQIIVMLAVITAPALCWTYKPYDYSEASMRAGWSYKQELGTIRTRISYHSLHINPSKEERRKAKEDEVQKQKDIKFMEDNAKSILSEKTQRFLNTRKTVCVEDVVPHEVSDLKHNPIALILFVTAIIYLTITFKRKKK